MFQNLGTGEVLLICLIIMILFGSKKLPEFTRGITDASREFKKGFKDDPSTTDSHITNHEQKSKKEVKKSDV